jgi:hypothetical protein
MKKDFKRFNITLTVSLATVFICSFLFSSKDIPLFFTGEKAVATVTRVEDYFEDLSYPARPRHLIRYTISYTDQANRPLSFVDEWDITRTTRNSSLSRVRPVYWEGYKLTVFYDKANAHRVIILSPWSFITPFVWLVAMTMGFLAIMIYRRNNGPHPLTNLVVDKDVSPFLRDVDLSARAKKAIWWFAFGFLLLQVGIIAFVGWLLITN